MAEAYDTAPEELICPICTELFDIPVTLSCQHNFCRKCIKTTWKKTSNPCRCPLCNKEFHQEPELHNKNTVLSALVDKFKTKQETFADSNAARSVAARGCRDSATHSSGGCRGGTGYGGHCERHGKLLELACVSHDCLAICLQGRSEQHSQCQVESLSECEEKQEHVKKKILQVTYGIDELEKSISQRGREKYLLNDSISSAKASLAKEFAALKRCIEEQERAAMRSIEDVEKAAHAKLDGIITQTSAKVDELKKIRSELEDMTKNNSWDLLKGSSSDMEFCVDYHMPEGGTFFDQEKINAIANAVSKLKKHYLESDLQMLTGHLEKELPVELPAEFSQEAMECSPAAESSGVHTKRTNAFSQWAASLRFDPKTANKSLKLSSERRKVTVAEREVPYPSNAERFKISQVFCLQSFCNGHHYWEVSTEHSDGWAIGIAYRRLGPHDQLGRNSHSWCLEWSNKKLSAWHQGPTQIEHAKPTIVGVLLAYDDGLLSFYSMAEAETLLHVYETKFTKPVYPAFWLYGLAKGNSLELIDMKME